MLFQSTTVTVRGSLANGVFLPEGSVATIVGWAEALGAHAPLSYYKIPGSRRRAVTPSSATWAGFACHSTGFISSSDTYPLYPI